MPPANQFHEERVQNDPGKTMADYEFTGTVKKVGDIQTFPSGFTKRELVVTSEEGRFPQTIPFEFLKEKGDQLDGIKESDRVAIHFDLSGREWTSPKDGTVKYFLSLTAWKIDKLDESGAASAPAPKAARSGSAAAPAPKAAVSAALPKDSATAAGDDDLPF
jgi:hypothetical protein